MGLVPKLQMGRRTDLRRGIATSMLTVANVSCPECDTMAMYKLDRFRQLPEILILEMDRLMNMDGTKLQIRCKIPAELDLNPIIEKQARDYGVTGRYRLVGVVCHSGSTPQDGHYVSYVRHEKKGWFMLDDDFVGRSSLSHMNADQASWCSRNNFLPRMAAYVKVRNDDDVVDAEGYETDRGDDEPAVDRKQVLKEASARAAAKGVYNEERRRREMAGGKGKDAGDTGQRVGAGSGQSKESGSDRHPETPEQQAERKRLTDSIAALTTKKGREDALRKLLTGRHLNKLVHWSHQLKNEAQMIDSLVRDLQHSPCLQHTVG